MIDQIKTREKNGILFEEKMKLISKVACKDIAQGQMVQWRDFYGTYQSIRRGDL
jgi:hypothetical protein